MSDHLKESLSALMDNEAQELELRRVLKEAEKEAPDSEVLLSCWSRYHLVRDVLKQQEPRQASPEILAGVREALAEDATPQQRKAGFGKHLWQVMGQGTIAASVALVVLVTAHSLQQRSLDDGMSMADGNNADGTGDLTASNANNQYVEGEFNRTVSYQGEEAGLDSQTRDRLRQAVYREIEQSPGAQYSIPISFPEVPQQQ